MIDSIGSYGSYLISPMSGWQNLSKVQPAQDISAPKSQAVKNDSYSFSDEGLELSRINQAASEIEGRNNGPTVEELSAGEQQQVEELRQRDREVKTHEQTHKSLLGPYAAGGPHYEYETGPENKRYAVGGSVDVDTSKEDTPEKTIQKAQVIKRASLGVQDPSGADKSVAAAAAQMEQEARMELAKEQKEMQRAASAYGAASLMVPADKIGENFNMYT